jgi:hypothetical protein
MGPGFRLQWHKNLVEHPELIDSLPKINCLPMKTLMPILRLASVDVWVLDVEGAEQLVLKGTDFEAFHPKVIVMECAGREKGILDAENVKYLQKYDYDCHTVSLLFPFVSLL